MIALANAQPVIGTSTTTLPYTNGIQPTTTTTPNNPPSLSGLSSSVTNSQPTLIIYYNNANGGYFAYVLSNQTDSSLFSNTPNIYENILPNATYYSQIPYASKQQVDNMLLNNPSYNSNALEQVSSNVISAINQNIGTHYFYSGAIFYSQPTSQVLGLECHFISSESCDNSPNGMLTMSNFTNYISAISTPYNATIIYQNANPTLLMSIQDGVATIYNSASTACLTGNLLAIDLSGGLCSIASSGLLIYNAVVSYFSSGNLAGQLATPIQIPLPEYAETMITTPQALTLIEGMSGYSSSQTLNVQFNYENNMLPTSNMGDSIYSFNTYIDGNIANQEISTFFGSSLLYIFVISIVCYIVLKFDGVN